nr:hypothetical protein CFP56_34897 [Quercus suber]
MADVEMTDAGAAPKVKSKAGPSDAVDNKKRFEVKKHSGHGTLSLTIAPSAEITSWICASTVKPTRHLRLQKSALWLGVSATKEGNDAGYNQEDGAEEVGKSLAFEVLGGRKHGLLEDGCEHSYKRTRRLGRPTLLHNLLLVSQQYDVAQSAAESLISPPFLIPAVKCSNSKKWQTVFCRSRVDRLKTIGIMDSNFEELDLDDDIGLMWRISQSSKSAVISLPYTYDCSPWVIRGLANRALAKVCLKRIQSWVDLDC